MTDLATELRRRAEADIAAARAAALAARASHARAEFLRHMMTTAAKVRDRPRQEAIDFVVTEWLAAWGQDRATCPQRPQMEALAGACQDMVRTPSSDLDDALRAAFAALEQAFAADGRVNGRRDGLAFELRP